MPDEEQERVIDPQLGRSRGMSQTGVNSISQPSLASAASPKGQRSGSPDSVLVRTSGRRKRQLLPPQSRFPLPLN